MTINEIAEEILHSKKYSNVDRAVVERIIAETIPKYPKHKDVIKAVKKELHIIHESFLQADCHIKAGNILDSYSGDAKNDKELSLRIMALHTSTKERLGQAAEIYEHISRYVKSEDTIIDIGCGFNPFTLPFFHEKPKNYFAFDINLSTVQTLNAYFKCAGLPYSAEISDAVIQTPGVHGDVLFMFKLFPLLERQKKGRAFEIMVNLDCKISIISFPLESTSGREKGMEAFYSAEFEKGLPSDFSITEKVKFTNEMFYIVNVRNNLL